MDTRKKLREACYFLNELTGYEQQPEIFDFYMSAFLHAWRGVMDVMLYDFSEYYALGFTREDELRSDIFENAAQRDKCSDGVKFIHWWLSKQDTLRINPLWRKRNLSTHRGYLGMAAHVYYLSGSGATSGTISRYVAHSGVINVESSGAYPVAGHGALGVMGQPVIQPDFASKRLEFGDIPGKNAIDVCSDAYRDMEKIVEEAEKTFKVSL